MTQIERVRQHYSICSLGQLAEFEVMIRVSPRPRIFGDEPSASVRGSPRILADLHPQDGASAVRTSLVTTEAESHPSPTLTTDVSETAVSIDTKEKTIC